MHHVAEKIKRYKSTLAVVRAHPSFNTATAALGQLLVEKSQTTSGCQHHPLVSSRTIISFINIASLNQLDVGFSGLDEKKTTKQLFPSQKVENNHQWFSAAAAAAAAMVCQPCVGVMPPQNLLLSELPGFTVLKVGPLKARHTHKKKREQTPKRLLLSLLTVIKQKVPTQTLLPPLLCFWEKKKKIHIIFECQESDAQKLLARGAHTLAVRSPPLPTRTY